MPSRVVPALLLALLVLCAVAVGDPPAKLTPREGPALPLPTLPPAPKVPANAAGETCVASADAITTRTQLDTFRRALVDVAAAKHGWRRLGVPRTISTRNPPAADGSVIDDHGQTWLPVGKLAPCGPELPDYFIDGDGGVFPLTPAFSCKQSVKLSACGMLAAPGCGQQPIPAAYYVAAPAGAHLLGGVDRSPVPLAIEVPTCMSFAPTGGWAYPPAAAH